MQAIEAFFYLLATDDEQLLAHMESGGTINQIISILATHTSNLLHLNQAQVKQESLFVESTWYSTKAIRILSNLLVSNNDQIMYLCLCNGILDIFNKILELDNF